jgi:hypothetical protein
MADARIGFSMILAVQLLGFFAGHAASIAFINSADSDKAYPIAQSGPTPIVGVELEVTQPSNVLVQFSSGATAETSDGCPCSIRAILRMNGRELMPVKRINLGSPAVVEQSKYQHDRQSIEGSLVFSAEPGIHRFELVIQQVSGTSKDLEIYYPNLQAIVFPR